VPVELDCVELVDLAVAGCWQLVVEVEFLGPVLVGSSAIISCFILLEKFLREKNAQKLIEITFQLLNLKHTYFFDM
jgi:hypothetical protein